MMNSVKEFGQVKINHRLITSREVSFCFGNGGERARRKVAWGRPGFDRPTGVGHAGAGASRLLAPRFLQQEASPLGCVRGLGLPAPQRAVGERDVQLSWSRLFQSIPSFAPLAFT